MNFKTYLKESKILLDGSRFTNKNAWFTITGKTLISNALFHGDQVRKNPAWFGIDSGIEEIKNMSVEQLADYAGEMGNISLHDQYDEAAIMLTDEVNNQTFLLCRDFVRDNFPPDYSIFVEIIEEGNGLNPHAEMTASQFGKVKSIGQIFNILRNKSTDMRKFL